MSIWYLSILVAGIGIGLAAFQGQPQSTSEGRRLFEEETFGGNGRTCRSCHGPQSGTLSPQEAQRRFVMNRKDPLFAHDGSDDGKGNGVSRILTEGTILVEIPLPPNVSLADDPRARSVTLRRAVPSTINTPALEAVFMLDGRDPDLKTQARNAIRSHYQSGMAPSDGDLDQIATFQRSEAFFSSPELLDFANGGAAPQLPLGSTESEKRGRIFFEDVFDPANPKAGSCAGCHSGPMLNQTNRFLPLPVPPGSRF